MNRIGRSNSWIAGIIAISAALVGCGKPAANTTITPAAPVPLKPTTPKESFLVILDTFKRGIEDVQAGFVAAEQDGHSMLTTTNKVTYELLAPTGEDAPYRANIIVTSTSRFSMLRDESDGEKNRNNDKDAKKAASTDLSDPTADPSEAELGIPLSGPNKSRMNVSGGEVSRRPPDESQRIYELVYKNGRWSLVTELDQETEKSIQNAFKHALDTQS